MKRTGRYLLRSFAAVGVLLLILVILLQTTWFRGLLVDKALEAVNESIRGNLEIGEIQGNLYSTIDLRDVRLLLDGDTVAVAGRIALRYELMPLLNQEVIVSSFLVDSPVLNLATMPDSILNIVYAASGESTDGPEDQTESADWLLHIDSLAFRQIQVEMAGEEEPTMLTNGMFAGSVHFDGDSLLVPIDSLSFLLRNPDFELQQCRAVFTQHGEQLSVRNLVLRTKENTLRGEFGYDFAGGTLSFDCFTEEMRLSEFVEDLDPRVANHRPVIMAAGWLRDDSLKANIVVREGSGELRLAGALGSIRSVPAYNIEGSIRGFDLSKFVNYPSFLSSMQADFGLNGEGVDPGDISMNGTLDLANAGVGEVVIHRLTLSLQILADDLRVSFVTRTSVGSAGMKAEVLDFTGKQLFTLAGEVDDLDLVPFLGLSTDISGSVESRGRFGSFDSMVVDLSVTADSVAIDTLRIDQISGRIRYHAGILTADSLYAKQDETSFNCSGVVDTAGNGSLQYDLRLGALAPLANIAGFDSLHGGGSLFGSVTRKHNDLHGSATVTLHDLILNDLVVGDLEMRVFAGFTRDSVSRIDADTVIFVLNNRRWENSRPWRFGFDDNGADVEYVGLRSGDQILEASGVLSLDGQNDFNLMMTRLDLSPIIMFVTGREGSGVLHVDATVAGTREMPEVSVTAWIQDGTIGERTIPDFDFTGDLKDSLVNWQVLLTREGGSLTGSGSVPVRLQKGGEYGRIDPGRPLHARLETTHFDLGSIPLLTTSDYSVQGILDAGIELEGTVENPDISGSVTVTGGSVKLPRWGLEYKGIRLALKGDGRGMKLDSFSVMGGDGRLDGSGMLSISYEDSLLIQPEFRFTAQQFDVLTGPVYSATIDGKVDVSGEESGRIILDGDITVKRSRIAIQHIKASGSARDLDPPLLMIASGRIDTSAGFRDSVNQVRLPPFTGTMKVSIPRATWLRGPRLNMELSGDVVITSSEELTTIRGFLSIEQGTYEFYGRKFVVVSGRVDFEETEKVDPVLFVEVEYLFDTDGTDNRLTIIVRGKSSDPQIEFFHNRSPISESDAISYIVFGRKADDLNYGQKSTVSDLGNALAMDLAANMINSQLSSTLGSALGLDVVRISGEDNWNKAVLTAGKYVTDDMFVAYERGITQSGSSGVAYESARLEYYLFRFLYVQLKEATDKTSGVDLFLKFD